MDNIGLNDNVNNVWAIASICCTIIGFIGGYLFAKIKFDSNNIDDENKPLIVDETLEKHLQNKVDTIWHSLVPIAENLKLKKADEQLDEFDLIDYKEQIEKAIYETEEIALMILPNRKHTYK